jgi:hypothetical protein
MAKKKEIQPRPAPIDEEKEKQLEEDNITEEKTILEE